MKRPSETPSEAGGPVVEVAAAVLHRGDRVWVRRRAGTGHLDGYWEFPGGKVEVGERADEALCRELAEELALPVLPTDLRFLLSQDFRYPDRSLRLHFFACRSVARLSNSAGRWVGMEELKRLRFPPANNRLLEKLPELLA